MAHTGLQKEYNHFMQWFCSKYPHLYFQHAARILSASHDETIRLRKTGLDTVACTLLNDVLHEYRQLKKQAVANIYNL